MILTKVQQTIAAAFVMLLITGCDDLTEKQVDVKINLDTFNLVGTNGLRATVTGNPACSADATTLNSLLATADNYDDFDEYLESIDINSVRYRITMNNTPVEATGLLQMTDPVTQEFTTIASVSVPANETTSEFAPFPFVDGGAAVVQHYMDNLDASFSYCAEGTPDSSQLNMTLELQLDMEVTIDVL